MDAEIKNVRVSPQCIEAGGRIKTHLDFSGSLRNGFFDNAIINTNGRIIDWNPDPSTWDRHRNSGTLHGKIETASEWYYFVPEWILPGKYVVSVRVYDDLDGTRKSRKLIIKNDVKVQFTKSKSDNIKFLFYAYEKLFNRNPDQEGIKNWYNFLQIRGMMKSQVIESGFVKSPEYRLRYFLKIIAPEKKITENQHSNWYNELKRVGVSDTNIFENIFSEIREDTKWIRKIDYVNKINKMFKYQDKNIEKYLEELSNKRINKVNFFIQIIDNQRFQKLIIFNKFFSHIINHPELNEKFSNYLDGLESFDNIWDKYCKNANENDMTH